MDVSNDEDAPVCICIAAVLDYWLYRKDKSRDKPVSYRLNLLKDVPEMRKYAFQVHLLDILCI